MDMLQNQHLSDIKIAEDTKAEFTGLSLWMKISAIISLAALAVSVISTVISVSNATRYGRIGGGNYLGLVINIALSLLVNITLLAAAKYTRDGIAASDQNTFNQGLRKFATYFRILGILFIIILVIAFLATVIVLIAGASRGFTESN